MEWDHPEAAEQVGEEVSGEAAVEVEGWEVPGPALDPAGNVSALIVGHAYHIKWAIPAIT